MPQSGMAEQLWSPWRFEYVSSAGGGDTEDLFLRLPSAGDDRASLILHRGETVFAVLNAYPYTSGHTMVVPFRKVARIQDMTDRELAETNRMVRSVIQWLDAVFAPQGYNIGVNQGAASGAGVPGHIHWHIVPRWSGDTNFMTTVGEVRVIPMGLGDAYERIMAAKGDA